MGLFSGLKKMFDTGGIKLSLDAPKSFSWDDGGIPVTVTVTGGDEPRTVTGLQFELEDVPEGDGPIGSSSRGASRTRVSSRPRFRLSYTHEGPFELAAKEVKTFELTVPITAEQNPGSGLADAVADTLLGGTISFGAAWYSLKVGAPVEGAKAIRTTSQRLKASGQLRATGGAGR